MSRFDQPDAPDDDPFGELRYRGYCISCGEEFSSKWEEDEVCVRCQIRIVKGAAVILDAVDALIDEEQEHPF